MKKLLLLVVMCFVGMMVPQVVLAAADVVVADGVVTITTTKAGDLQQYLQSASDADIAEIRSASTIVFDGKFNKADLEALNGAGCCTQTTVDMSEAKFVKPAGPGENTKTYLYHDINARNNDNQDKHPGDLCIVGATKYKSAMQSSGRSWHPIGEDEIADGQSWQTRNYIADDVNNLSYNYDVYLKLPTTLNYYQLIVETNQTNDEISREWVLIQNPSNEQMSSAAELDGQYTASSIDGLKQNYSPNQIVKVRPDNCDYKFFTNEATYKFVWESVSGTNEDYQNGATNQDAWYSNIDEAPSPTNYGQYILAGGTEYLFKGPAEGWIDASQSGDEELDFKDMSFKYWGSNVTKAITSKYVDPTKPLDKDLCTGCSALTDLTINSGTIHKIANGNNKPPLEKVTIGNKVAQIGNHNADGAFANYTTIQKVVFEKGGTDALVITSSSFIGCSSLTEVEIPVRTTLIESQAFGQTGLKKVTFEAATEPASPLVIKSEAFENSTSISDVYVNVSPAMKALVCEYNAFNFNTMDGQTEPANYDDMATLHFDVTDKEFYKGAWKEGFGFTQTELLAIRGQSNHTSDVIDAIPIQIGNNADLVDNKNKPKVHEGEQYNGYPMGYLTNKPANGWQQFAKTGNEIPVTGRFLRSYSTSTPYEMPTYGTSGQAIVKIYRIWNFDDGYTSQAEGHESEVNTETPKKAYAREIVGHIPDHTGVIMVGITDQNVLYNFKKFSGTVTKFVFTDQGGNANVDNLLVPSNDDTLPIGPTDKSGNEITHRNFGFKVYTESGVKYGKFLRASPTTKIKPNHAYLKLNKDLFHWRNESGGTSNYDAAVYKEDEQGANSNSKLMISFIYSLDEEEEFGGGIATIIRKAIEDADMEDGEFYTLQGVKVNKPTTKGVYIHNGKKVLVK